METDTDVTDTPEDSTVLLYESCCATFLMGSWLHIVFRITTSAAKNRNTSTRRPQSAHILHISHDREDHEQRRRRISAESPDVFSAVMLADCIIFIRRFPWADPDVSLTRWGNSKWSWWSFSTFISSWGLTWIQRRGPDKHGGHNVESHTADDYFYTVCSNTIPQKKWCLSCFICF